MFTIVGGNTQFTQWDLNQKVTGDFMEVGKQIIFQSASGKAIITYSYMNDGVVVAEVPNILLQNARPILVNYEQGANAQNQYDTRFAVVAADKPADYVYTDNTDVGKPSPNSGSGVSSWNDLTDKPFYDETPEPITWDGNTEGLVSVLDQFYKVSDLVLTDKQIKSLTIYATVTEPIVISDEIWEELVSQGAVTEDWVVVLVGDVGIMVVRTDNASVMGQVTVPEKGVYFWKSGDEYVSSIVFPSQVKTLDEKYSPFKPLIINCDGLPSANSTYTMNASNYSEARAMLDTFPFVALHDVEDKVYIGKQVKLDTQRSSDYKYLCSISFEDVILNTKFSIRIVENGEIEYIAEK